MLLQFLFFYICRMSKKGYFGILITVFTMLVVMRQQTVVPNQEIVLDFIAIESSSPEAQKVIASVKKQLLCIGVKNPRISENSKDGKLKITYYSDSKIERIKEMFSNENSIALSHLVLDHKENQGDEFPKDNQVKNYSLKIYEIQSQTDFGFDLNGKFVLEVKQKRDGNYDTNVYSLSTLVDIYKIDSNLERNQKTNANIALIQGNTLHNIPEVRAGPIS